VQTY